MLDAVEQQSVRLGVASVMLQGSRTCFETPAL